MTRTAIESLCAAFLLAWTFDSRLLGLIPLNQKKYRKNAGESGMHWAESIVMVMRLACFTVIVTSPAWMFAVYFLVRG